jgi:ABC-type glycerol-3-phosphate transport system substrate-binding protein
MNKTVVVLIAIALLLIHCKSDIYTENKSFDNQLSNIKKTKSLNWIGQWKGEGEKELMVENVAREYAFENQDVSFKLSYPSDLVGSTSKSDYSRLLAKKIMEGTLEWDVIWLDATIYSTIAIELKDPEWGKKYLVDFVDVPGFKESQKEFISTDPYYKTAFNGILPGSYIEGYYYLLWYNKDLADKMGIEIKPKGMTFDDFAGYIKAVNEYNQKNNTEYAAIFESKNWINTEILFQNLFLSELNTADIQSVDGESRFKALDKTLKSLESLAAYQPFAKDVMETDWHKDNHKMLEDKYLFFINGTWMYSQWNNLNPEKMKRIMPVELPAFREPHIYLGDFNTAFAVLKNSPNVTESLDLVKFWSRPEIAEKWLDITKSPTAVKGAFSSSNFGSDVFEEFNNYISHKYGNNIRYFITRDFITQNVPQSDNFDLKRFKRLVRDMMNGKMTSEDIYKEMKLK